MKTIIKYITLLLLTTLASYSYAQVRVSNYTSVTNATNGPAFIDASSSPGYNGTPNLGKGLLFPRVDLSAFTFPSITTGIATNYPTRCDGMIVYNTKEGGIAGAGATEGELTPGFWYYENKSSTLTGGTWRPLGGGAAANVAEVKTLEISLDEILDIQSKTFFGTTDAASSAIKIVSIEPQLTGDPVMLGALLKVNATANLSNDAKVIKWTVAVENDNINASINSKLEKVIISYMCDDDLTGVHSGTYSIAGR